MRHAFQQLPELRAQLENVDSAPVQALREKMGEFAELRDLLERAIIDTPPVLVRDGGVIASGYNEELDEWRALADGATDYLERLEVRERERTGFGHAESWLLMRCTATTFKSAVGKAIWHQSTTCVARR